MTTSFRAAVLAGILVSAVGCGPPIDHTPVGSGSVNGGTSNSTGSARSAVATVDAATGKLSFWLTDQETNCEAARREGIPFDSLLFAAKLDGVTASGTYVVGGAGVAEGQKPATGTVRFQAGSLYAEGFAGTVTISELSEASVKGSFDLKTDEWLHPKERFTGVFDAPACEGLRPDAPTWSNHKFKEY